MRVSLAEQSARPYIRAVSRDRRGLAARSVFFVALPLASSSPVPDAEPTGVGGSTSRRCRCRWRRPHRFRPFSPFRRCRRSRPCEPSSITRTAETEIQPAPQPKIVTASLGGYPTSEPPYRAPAQAAPVPEETIPTEDAEAVPLQEPSKAAPPRARRDRTMDQIDAYLWEVYQRQPTKKDRDGDFTWKDPAAAKRMGKTLQAYVIIGMDADLREPLYHAGQAMDAAGIEWTIVSGFRDDCRQSIAAGIKARTGFSRHGGSRASRWLRPWNSGRHRPRRWPQAAWRGVELARSPRHEVRAARVRSAISIRRMSSRAATGARSLPSCARAHRHGRG